MKKVLIAGGSGLIGKALSKMLLDKDYEVGVLSRSSKSSIHIKHHLWNLESMTVDQDVLQYQYLVNLTGAGIADKRWSDKRKKEIIDSRVKSTKLLYDTFKDRHSLRAVINASAIGYYGDSGDTLLTEESGIQNKEFLSEVCDIWERAADPLKEIAKRLVILRIGTVLSSKGGALEKMVPPIKMGVASYLGNGQQWMSWIHIEDICRMIIYLLENENTQGVYNGVSPNPEKNIDFTEILKRVINRFAIEVSAPKFGIKIAFGELSRLVLNSNRVSAQKILDAGFQFDYPELDEALQDLF